MNTEIKQAVKGWKEFFGFPPPSMFDVDVNKLRLGMKLKYTFPESGTDTDQIKAAHYLRLGRIYTVRDFEIHDWYTDIWVSDDTELPIRTMGSFNSVMFSEAEDDE